MTRIALSERVRVAVVRAQGLRRQAAANIAQSRFVRWRHGRGTLGQLVIAPQNLRTCDPSFWAEIESGSFGLSGNTARLNGRSPFELTSHGAAWQSNLHGFGWLRHLEAAGDTSAAYARAKVPDAGWKSNRQGSNPAAQCPSRKNPGLRLRQYVRIHICRQNPDVEACGIGTKGKN